MSTDATTRITGTITKTSVRGDFCFASRDDGRTDIFIHVSEFPRNVLPPKYTKISFAISTGRDGRPIGVLAEVEK